MCSQSLWKTESNLQQSVCNLQLYWNNSRKDIFSELQPHNSEKCLAENIYVCMAFNQDIAGNMNKAVKGIVLLCKLQSILPRSSLLTM